MRNVNWITRIMGTTCGIDVETPFCLHFHRPITDLMAPTPHTVCSSTTVGVPIGGSGLCNCTFLTSTGSLLLPQFEFIISFHIILVCWWPQLDRRFNHGRHVFSAHQIRHCG